MFFFLNVKINFSYKKSFFKISNVSLKYYFCPESSCELILILKMLPVNYKIYWLESNSYKMSEKIYFFRFFICVSRLFKKTNIISCDSNNKIIVDVGGCNDYFSLLRFYIKNNIKKNKLMCFFSNTINDVIFYNKQFFLNNFGIFLCIKVISRFGKVFFYGFKDISYYYKELLNNNLYIMSVIFIMTINENIVDTKSILIKNNVFLFDGYKFLCILERTYFVFYYNIFYVEESNSVYLDKYLRLSRYDFNLIIILKCKTLSRVKLFLSYLSYKIRRKYNVILLYKLF